MTELRWLCRDRPVYPARRPLVLGIVNVTPDSFSDGGKYHGTAAAVAHGMQLAADGADWLDVGGESTRPGAEPVSLDEELRRVVPVVRALAGVLPVSVDTSKAEVARQCLDAGALVINDVTGLTGDPQMAAVARDYRAGVIVMHMQGTPRTMQENPRYADVLGEVVGYCEARLHALADAGIDPECVALDPGIGFGKTHEHNLTMLANLERFGGAGRPVLLGVSRKGVLSNMLGGGRPTEGREAAGLAVMCHALSRRSAQLFRVHDVRAAKDAVLAWAALEAYKVALP